MFKNVTLLTLAAAMLCWIPLSSCTAAPLQKVDPAAVTVTQYAPDDKVVGLAPELTDGNDRTRWICRNVTDQNLPLRLVFDLGKALTVGKVRIANYYTGANFNRGIKTVDVFVGDALAPAAGGLPAAADVEVKISDAAGPAWTEIPLANPAAGRLVTVRVNSNWGGGSYAANEVELFAADTAATAAPAASVIIVKTFPADFGPSHKDHPDEAGAVGPDHVVDFDDVNFVVHDKATGRVLVKKTQEKFWAEVEPANTLILDPNDPRILFDPLSNRWFAVNTGKIAGTRTANGYLAVSTSSDPTKPWKGVKLPMPPQDLGFKLGVDKNGLYACYINQTGNVSTMHDCIAIPKADAIAPGGPDLSHLNTFHNLQIESFPATDLNPNKAPTDPEVLLNKEFGNNAGKLYFYKITWAGTKASISDVQTIPLGKIFVTPNGASLQNQALQPAPGGKLRADEGRRTICVFAHGGSVFGCNEAKRTVDSRPGILWYEVRVKDGALLQEGFVDDPDHDYLCPSLAVDKSGNIGLGCTRTSATEFPSIYVMMHAAGDAPGTMRPPVLALAGTTHYRDSKAGPSGIGWGNYSSTCLDPSDPDRLWTCQQYGNSVQDLQWCTAWVAFQLNLSVVIPTGAAIPVNPPPATTIPATQPANNVPAGQPATTAGGATFTGTASATHTFKRPILIVDGKRYELKASDKADAAVAGMLAKFSGGDTGAYVVKGTRAIINGTDGILVDSITPVAAP